MAAGINLPTFPAFDPDSDQSSLSQRWSKWIARFENFLVAADVTDSTRKRALLLHQAGERVHDIFDTLDGAGGADDYDKVKKCLTDFFTPKKNTAYEVLVFRRSKQYAEETLDQFHTRLQTLAAHCGFYDKNTEIKDQIIQNCASSRLRRRILELKPDDSTLTAILDIGRRMETASRDATEIENSPNRNDVCPVRTNRHAQTFDANHGKRDDDDVNYVRGQQTRRKPPGKTNFQGTIKCRNCGGQYPHPGGQTDCRAYGKTCFSCGSLNHFSSFCRKSTNSSGYRNSNDRSAASSNVKTFNHNTRRQDPPHQLVRNVQDEGTCTISDNSDDDYSYHVTGNAAKCNKPQTVVHVNGIKTVFLIDTGSSLDTMTEHVYTELFKSHYPLQENSNNAYPYAMNIAIPIIGSFTAEIVSRHSKVRTTIHVVKGARDSLLSFATSRSLQLVKITNAVSEQHQPNTVEQIVFEYSDRFQGLGKFTDFKVKLHIDENVLPVAQSHRRQPFHTRLKVDKELERLQQLDIIEPATGPTTWASPIVTPPKPKDPEAIRICVDMRIPNQSIIRQRHPTPTVHDIIYRLNGASIFSKLDLNNGYHQLELEEDSRHITTFSTYRGLYRYKRLNFGISCAAEIFQRTIHQVIEGVCGADNISDDIIIYGNDQSSHDHALRSVLQRLREKNLTLNPSKCEFNKSEIEFFGYIFSKDGISPDPKKVKAVKEATPPANDSETRSFLGLVNYCSRFIPDFATVTKPLRDLTRKGTRFSWGHEQQHAFNTVKKLLTADSTIAYFDPAKSSELTVDAGPVGLGAVLMQYSVDQPSQKCIIAYASRALTDVEQRYSQTEREALALVWGCEHFHIYLYGSEFTTVVTDHKPLEAIFNNPKSKPPARIERWALRLQPYKFRVKYRPGIGNPADYMSRHPVNQFIETKHQQVAEQYINALTLDALPKALTLQEIRVATRDDVTLQAVMDALCNRKWPSKLPTGVNVDVFRALGRIQDELSVNPQRDIVLRGSRIIIPTSLQRRTLQLAHEGHQGLVKTKQLLREQVWFAGIDRQAEQMIKSCIPCQAVIDTTKPTPLLPTSLPRAPWTELSVDFCGPLPSGDYLLVVIDDYSRYPEVEIVTTTSARAVVPKLDKIFSIFGIPDVLKSDNGPPFQGSEFADFAADMGFKHRRVTPLWPQANGEVERFMQPLMKAVKCANSEHMSWRQTLYTFLRNYRATPHSSTGKSPAEIIFGRRIKTKLPSVTEKSADETVANRDEIAKNSHERLL